ncbi:MAG: hypothetical protein KAS87_05330 [Candidatus Omnitrophica bacterium]|nr:hypothetical protein [Candidatus Omnitrophota bacterium]
MRAILITFSAKSSKFNSAYERNQFYRELYGWKQIIIRNYRRYEYQKSGLMDEIPHIKVDKSVFIVARNNLERLRMFFNKWDDKTRFSSFEIKINKEEAKTIKVE